MAKTSESLTKETEKPLVRTQNTNCTEKPNTFAILFELCTNNDVQHFTSYNHFTKWLHRPVDASALGVFRMMYGKLDDMSKI